MIFLLLFWTVESSNIMFCPNMGRYGNQLDHYVSMMHLAKQLDKPLVLTPLIRYHRGDIELLPFENVFNVSKLATGLKVTSLDDIDKTSIKSLFCHKLAMKENGYPCVNCGDQSIGCKPEGSPNKPYWDKLGINFENSIDLSEHLQLSTVKGNGWEKYEEIDTIVFASSFMRFPSSQDVNYLHQYISFHDDILEKADKVLSALGSILSVHLRNGRDWLKACDMIRTNNLKTLFTSNQCPSISLSYPVCYQTADEVVAYLSKISHQKVFVSGDNNLYINEISSIKQVHQLPNNLLTPETEWQRPFIEMAIHAKSDLFIANCVSSFSAFIVKGRRVRSQRFQFWGDDSKHHHQELK